MKKIYLSLAILFAIVFGSATLAQTESGEQISEEELTAAVAETQAIVEDELENLDGVNLVEPEKIPGNFGLWWKSIRESVSLMLTVDPVKKAEKQLMFAEEKIKLANLIAENSDDPAAQEKAAKLIEKSNALIEKIKEKTATLTEKIDEKKQRLLENTAKHELNKEKVLNKLEDNVSVENFEKFQEIKLKIQERTDSFLSKISENENIPESTMQKILVRKEAIGDRQEARVDLREEMKALLEKAKNGDTQAKEQINEQRDALKEKRQEINAQFKIKAQEIITQIKNGDMNRDVFFQKLEQIKSNPEVQTQINKIQTQVQNRTNKPLATSTSEVRIIKAEQGSQPSNGNAGQNAPSILPRVQTQAAPGGVGN